MFGHCETEVYGKRSYTAEVVMSVLLQVLDWVGVILV